MKRIENFTENVHFHIGAWKVKLPGINHIYKDLECLPITQTIQLEIYMSKVMVFHAYVAWQNRKWKLNKIYVHVYINWEHQRQQNFSSSSICCELSLDCSPSMRKALMISPLNVQGSFVDNKKILCSNWSTVFNQKTNNYHDIPLSPDVKMHILLTILHIFLMEQVRRVCLNIMTSYSWWLPPLFSLLDCFNK